MRQITDKMVNHETDGDMVDDHKYDIFHHHINLLAWIFDGKIFLQKTCCGSSEREKRERRDEMMR